MVIRALAPGNCRSTRISRASVFAVTVVMSAQLVASVQQAQLPIARSGLWIGEDARRGTGTDAGVCQLLDG